MSTRKRKTDDQVFNHHMRLAQAAKARGKKVEKAKRTRQLILHGEALVARAAAGDPVSQAEVERNLAGFTRKHDRAAFDLEPLSEPRPDDQQPVNPPVVNPPKPAGPGDVQARLDAALAAWRAAMGGPRDTLEPLRIELGQAIGGVERVSGQLWPGLPAKDRAFYGLGDRVAELLKAA